MSSPLGGTAWLTLGAALNFLIGLGLQIALLVTVLTVVRKHRPAAVPMLASSFVVNLLSTVLSVVVYDVALPMVMARGGGIDSYGLFSAATSVGFSLVHAFAGVLLILGLVKLATPEAQRLGA